MLQDKFVNGVKPVLIQSFIPERLAREPSLPYNLPIASGWGGGADEIILGMLVVVLWHPPYPQA